MSEYNKDEYRAALRVVKELIQDMDDAMDGLDFEHGDGGISDRAISHLGSLNAAMNLARIKQAEIARLIAKAKA